VKSITLIAPKSRNKSASDLSVLTTPLTGLLILATMLHKKGYSVKFFDESFKTPNYNRIDSDYILISSMSATVNRAYELADFFRLQGMKVFLGGLHASFNPDEALQHCDRVVIGEGSLKNMFGRKFRTVSTDNLIKYLLKFKKIKTLCFDEPNFTADKQRAIDILTKMKENNIYPKYAWPSVSIDVAKNDKLLKLCSEVSEFNFLLGLESIYKKVLDYYNKKQTPESIKNALKKLHDYGIKIHGSFIFGSDYDDNNVFQKTVDFCHDAEVDFPGFFPLTPYVGTDIRKELEGKNRIFTNNWDYYDGAHVVYYPKNMSPYELQEGIISAFENFYSNSKVINHIRRGEFFYGLGTLYFKVLIKRIIRQNEDYLDYLYDIKN